jgi:transposase-like protein
MMARTEATNPRDAQKLFPCPHKDCPSNEKDFVNPFPKKNMFSINRVYKKKSGTKVTSYLCRFCEKYFTDTNEPSQAYYKYSEFPVRKFQLLNLYNGGLSLRYLAQVQMITRKRIVHAIKEHSATAKAYHQKAVEIKANEEIGRGSDSVYIEFDEQETYLRNKLHPISIPTAVDRSTGFVIGFAVATFQPLRNNKKALQFNNGIPWPDTREECFAELAEQIKAFAKGRKIIICADMKKIYVTWVMKYLPKAILYQVPSNAHKDDKGELKLNRSSSTYRRKKDKDGNTLLSTTPIIWGKVIVNKNNEAQVSFTHKKKKTSHIFREGMNHLYRIDHYFSMVRKNLARMKRKAHSTTKNIDFLRHQLYIHLAVNNKYPMFTHSTFYVKPSKRNTGYVAYAHEKHKALFAGIRLTWSEIREGMKEA